MTLAHDEGRDVLLRSLSAGHWSLLNTILQNVLTYATFFITARMLLPADFGVIAIASIFPSFLDAASALAFESAAIQKKGGGEKVYLNAIWTFQILRACVISVIVFICAPIIAHVFNAEEYISLFMLGGLMPLIQSLSNIGQIYFFRDLDFKKVFLRDMVTKITASVSSVVLAFLLRSFWALFIAQTLSLIASSAITYVLSSYRPRLDFRFRPLIELLPYSRWVYGQTLLNQLTRNLQDSTVAMATNPAEVGFFTKARSLGYSPMSPILGVVNKISFSAYSLMQDSIDHVREGFHKSFELLVAIAVPFLFTVFIGGNRIILVLLGAQWLPAVGYLQVLSAAAAIDVLAIALIAPVANGLGIPKNQFTTQAISLVALVIFLVIFVPFYGTFGVALAILCSSVIAGAHSLIRIHRVIRLDLKRIAQTIGVAIASALIPLPVGLLLLQFPFANTTFGFLLLAASMGFAYFSLITLCGYLWSAGPAKTLLLIMRSFRQRTNAS